MDDGHPESTIDLIRWTFAVNPEHAVAIEEHLADLGLDVLVREESLFVATWDEPEGDLDALIEAIWAINEEPFEITQEEFHRRNLFHIHHEEEGEGEAVEDAQAA